MNQDQINELILASAFGTLSGMRTMSGPTLAALLRALNEEERGVMEDRLNSRKAISGLAILALGEVVADKLPGMGDRIEPASLLVRALAGALSGALVCKDENPERVGAAAGAGAIAALASTFAAFHLRRSTAEATALPDPLLGLIEDAVVYGSGAILIQQLVD